MKPSQPSESLTQYCDDFIEKDTVLLQQALEKVVRFGQQVGVTPEEMISLLDSGMSIGDLLAFLTSKTSGDS